MLGKLLVKKLPGGTQQGVLFKVTLFIVYSNDSITLMNTFARKSQRF